MLALVHGLQLFTDLLKGSYKKLNKSQRVAAATLLFK